jgi:hypothetical protein
MGKWAHIALLLSVSPVLLLGQQVGFSIGHASPVPMASRGAGLTISFQTTRPGSFDRRHLFSPAFYNYPFLSSDYVYQPIANENVVPPTQFVIVQTPQETAPEQKPAELLLIERHGDRFVRIRETEQEEDVRFSQNESREALISEGSATRSPRPERQFTVLVFRDGRREEASNYTIVDGVLYQATDFWSTGSWTKSIKLALLNLPATVRENQVRGVKFFLPSGPHEVVVR